MFLVVFDPVAHFQLLYAFLGNIELKRLTNNLLNIGKLFGPRLI